MEEHFLEISPLQADEGELIGKHPGDVPPQILSQKFRAQNPGSDRSCLVHPIVAIDRPQVLSVQGLPAHFLRMDKFRPRAPHRDLRELRRPALQDRHLEIAIR
jgi:hypothetical protein